jgi:hypothetical protein
MPCGYFRFSVVAFGVVRLVDLAAVGCDWLRLFAVRCGLPRWALQPFFCR